MFSAQDALTPVVLLSMQNWPISDALIAQIIDILLSLNFYCTIYRKLHSLLLGTAIRDDGQWRNPQGKEQFALIAEI